MKPPSKIILATIAHFIFLAVMLVIVWMNAHWSVALLCTWMAFTISSFATMVSKFRHKMVQSVKGLEQRINRSTDEFNRFIGTINTQAAAFKKEINICRECEKHPGAIRPGSIHVHGAENCQLKNLTPMQPPEIPKEKPLIVCTRCKEEGYTDTNYKQGNCPIHD